MPIRDEYYYIVVIMLCIKSKVYTGRSFVIKEKRRPQRTELHRLERPCPQRSVRVASFSSHSLMHNRIRAYHALFIVSPNTKNS